MHKAIEEVQIEKVKNALADDPNVVFAILFGSRARGKTLKGLQKSDIDLAVYFKNPPEGLALLDYISKLSDKVGDEIDLVVLNRASAFLRHQVMKERILLICKDQEIYRRFREKTISDYQEYKYISGMEKYDR